jgi:hypothetical protein
MNKPRLLPPYTFKTEAAGSFETLVPLHRVTHCNLNTTFMFILLVIFIIIIIIIIIIITRGLISLWLYKKKQQATGLKKCIYSTYSPLSSTYLWLRYSNFFNPSKKNYFGCAASRKIGNRKSQRLIRTPTYYYYLSSSLWSRNGSVSKVTKMEYGRIRVRLMEKLETFLFFTESRPSMRSTQPPLKWVQGTLPPGVKRLGHEDDHLSASTAEVPNIWSYTSTRLHIAVLN